MTLKLLKRLKFYPSKNNMPGSVPFSQILINIVIMQAVQKDGNLKVLRDQSSDELEEGN